MPLSTVSRGRVMMACPAIMLMLGILQTGLAATRLHAAEPSNTLPDNTTPRYRWQAGQPYSYRFTCKAEVGDTLLEARGTNTYTLGRPMDVDPLGAARGTGTAFVVSSTGYLLTCDHVVEQAADLRVILDGKSLRQHS